MATFGFMTETITPLEAAEEYNRLQKIQIENTRLGIPATRSAEGIFAFKACLDSGASSVMMAYNTLNGIPCATHKWLITDIMKEEWGFEGYVSTDGNSSQLIFDEGGTHETPEALAADLLNAGCDRSLPTWFFNDPLRKALEQGMVSQKRVDDAVRRMLKQKFESGIFENPYVDPTQAEYYDNKDLEGEPKYTKNVMGTSNNYFAPVKVRKRSFWILCSVF